MKCTKHKNFVTIGVTLLYLCIFGYFWGYDVDDDNPTQLTGHSAPRAKAAPVPTAECNRGAKNDVCCLLPADFTASSLWTEMLTNILTASSTSSSLRGPSEVELRKLLYSTVPPSRLRRALRSRPANVATIAHIAEILQARIRSPETSPPLKIAVLGGSVTIGRGCGPGMQDVACAWPNRFESLINSLAGIDLVKIVNMGNGGTSTSQGRVIIKYWMYPKELAKYGPDVIINSFSANDSLPPGWWLKGDEKPETIDGVKNAAWDANQGFLRAALQTKLCSVPPLVLHVDDYLGHQQDALLGDMQYNDAVTRLSQWYGTGFVSYADVVRDLVYVNTSETTFSAAWGKTEDDKLKVDVHFGPAAHQVIAWTLAFAAIDMASGYCNDRNYDMARIADAAHNLTTGDAAVVVEADNNHLGGLEVVTVLPPPLTRDLMFHKVSDLWNESIVADKKNIQEYCTGANGGTTHTNPCVFAFNIGPSGMSNSNTFNSYVKPYISNNDGWGWEDSIKKYGWTNKLGFVAKKAKAKFVVAVKNLDRPIRVITLITMKSYGDKWEGSLARFDVSVSGSDKIAGVVRTSMDVAGVHNSTASISHTSVMRLDKGGARKGDDLMLEIELLGGTEFKIQGMMMCSF